MQVAAENAKDAPLRRGVAKLCPFIRTIYNDTRLALSFAFLILISNSL